MTEDRKRVNIGRILEARKNKSLTFTLKLLDEEFINILEYGPRRIVPGRYRHGRVFRIFPRLISATWQGGGWWQFTSVSMEDFTILQNHLLKIWGSNHAMRQVPISFTSGQPASKEVRDFYIAKIREILAREKT